MARAGFYAVESRDIRFRRDGVWTSDGEPIENPRIAGLFSRSLRPDPEGGWMLQVGDERAHVEVEGTPWVVVAVDGDPSTGFRVRTNDGAEEPLDVDALRVDEDGALVTRVKDGAHEARLLRPAQAAIGPWFEPCDGGFALRSGDRRCVVRAT